MPDSNESYGFNVAAHPNDAFFKVIFSDPEHAAAFFQNHLPAEVTSRIDWQSLKLQPGSFVKTTLQQVHSDLLFKTRLDGRETLLYLLFEHQSTVDSAMPLRLLGYLTEVLLNHFQHHGLPLPPVLAFVLHQGPERWTVSTEFADLFALPDDLTSVLGRFLPKFQHALLDLSSFDPASEEHDAKNRIVLQLMKLARERQLRRFFDWLTAEILPSVHELPESLFKKLLLYAFCTDSDLDREEILDNLMAIPETKNAAMSIAEQLRAEGRAEGRSLGLWVGKIQMLQDLMGLKVTPHDDLAKLGNAKLEEVFNELHRQYNVRFKS
ncbi:MAG: Rpn family recombination-promoting nuclease/putative transposase [Verrucomicrobiota bacterium]